MAAKSKSKAKAVKAAPQFASYVEKNVTATQAAYAAWLTEQTGYAVDVTTVKLALRLNSTFRSSPERVSLKEARKAEREAHAAGVEARRQERAEKRAAALEEKARLIREGKVRGPGRPRKVKEAAPEPVEVEPVEDEDFSEDAQVEVVPDESEVEVDEVDLDEDEDDEDFEDDEDEDF